MTDELLESINKRLALLIKATLADELEGKTRAEQVTFLEDMDYRDEDILEVLGISPGHLRKIRSRRDG